MHVQIHVYIIMLEFWSVWIKIPSKAVCVFSPYNSLIHKYMYTCIYMYNRTCMLTYSGRWSKLKLPQKRPQEILPRNL